MSVTVCLSVCVAHNTVLSHRRKSDITLCLSLDEESDAIVTVTAPSQIIKPIVCRYAIDVVTLCTVEMSARLESRQYKNTSLNLV